VARNHTLTLDGAIKEDPNPLSPSLIEQMQTWSLDVWLVEESSSDDHIQEVHLG
jgi:hypothetical protein